MLKKDNKTLIAKLDNMITNMSALQDRIVYLEKYIAELK